MEFMDFCAGIGGGRLGLELNGLKCVAYSEIDDSANETYKLFFDTDEKNYGDLMKIDPKTLPRFDMLIGGFPCQTFSIVGKRAGFEDYRGQVIYGLIKILTENHIPCFILENVKGLVNHDGGRTIQIIFEALTQAGYCVQYKVLNSENYGVPQLRERVYFVGMKKNLIINEFKWPAPVKMPDLRDYLIDEDSEILDFNNSTFQKYLNNKYNKGRFNFEEILKEDYLVLDTRQSDLRLYRGKTPTLRTGRHGVLYVKSGKLHRLSGYEALLLQGFPKDLAERAKKSGIKNTKLLSQAGNAMTVPAIQAIAKALLESIGGSYEEEPADNAVLRGSETARNGFKNEKDVVKKFNSWQTDQEAQKWLTIMQYDLSEIESVSAEVLNGYKADVNVKVQIKMKAAVDTENIQVKLVSTGKGFNQVDKRRLEHYKNMWNIPDNVYEVLQYFTGEKLPYKANTTKNNRMIFIEMESEKQEIVVNWFNQNKTLIISDIIKGRGMFSAEWMLVAQKVSNNSKWVLKNINEVLQHYSQGSVVITPRGSLHIGRVTVQRKGGDSGRDSAKMLQFKIDPTELFDK